MKIAEGHCGGDEELRSWLGRNRWWVMLLLIAAALPCFWYDYRHQAELVMTIIGINMIVAALRLLIWGSGVKSAERQRLERLEEHRRPDASISGASPER
ncbi:MAG TPA: hypothetical protein VHW24_07455 [Bryobacteraceae bacterium]|nr:hypothetical protein [Bryobacteraceae bacterium]